jgi:hypothetical protein
MSAANQLPHPMTVAEFPVWDTPDGSDRWTQRAWRLRLAALDRAAAAEIRRLRATGLSFTAALNALLASASGTRAFAEYSLICDALAAEGCATAWLN